MRRIIPVLFVAVALLVAACATESLDRAVGGTTSTPTATATATSSATASAATATATPAGGSATATAVPLQPPAPTATAAPQPTATPPPAPTPVATPTPPVTGSGVFGMVTVGPSCPVQRIDQPCPDKPYPGTLVLTDAAGREVARVTAGDDGTYAVALPPGTYHVVAQPPPGRPLPRGGDADVTVTAGNWTRLDMQYDSGIR